MQVLDTGNRRDLLHTALSDFLGRVASRMWLWWQNSDAHPPSARCHASWAFWSPGPPNWSISPAWPLRRLWHVTLPPPVSWLLLPLAVSSALMLLCVTDELLGWVRTLPSHAVLVEPHLWSEAQILHSEQLLKESTSFLLLPGGPLFEWLHPRIQLGSWRALLWCIWTLPRALWLVIPTCHVHKARRNLNNVEFQATASAVCLSAVPTFQPWWWGSHTQLTATRVLGVCQTESTTTWVFLETMSC